MNETYVECLVARKPSMIMKFFSVLCTMLAVVFFLLVLVYIFAWVVALAAGIGAYVLNGRCNTEYEYLYVDREISVDRILAKNRRKNPSLGQIFMKRLCLQVMVADITSSVRCSSRMAEVLTPI